MNNTEIEDNVLNLQTIAGSRFVSAFVDRVRHWERILNMVSECLEAWFIVQRKWAYLEGIFIGIIVNFLILISFIYLLIYSFVSSFIYLFVCLSINY